MFGMDTQRLILFVIFSFSALLLWEAWQKREHAPPPPPQSQRNAGSAPRRHAAAPARRRPAPGAPRAAAPRAVPGAHRPRPPPRPPARPITITTDLYAADVDTQGGAITARRARRASRCRTTRRSPTSLLLRTPSARSSRSRACSARACPTIAPSTRRCPARASSRPGADRSSSKLQATAANGDKVVQMLTFHRGSYVIDVAYDVTNNGAAPISPVRLFPAHARHQDAGARTSSMAPAVVHRAGHLQRDRQVQEGRIRRDRQARRRPVAQAPVHEERRQRLGRDGRALLRRGVASVRRQEAPREFYARKLDGGLYSAGVIVPVGTIAPGATGDAARAALRRPAGAGRAGEARQGPRPRRRLRHLHGHRGAAVLAAQVAARPRPQLGLGDHRCSRSSSRARSIRSTTRARARWRR